MREGEKGTVWERGGGDGIIMGRLIVRNGKSFSFKRHFVDGAVPLSVWVCLRAELWACLVGIVVCRLRRTGSKEVLCFTKSRGPSMDHWDTSAWRKGPRTAEGYLQCWISETA